MYYRAIPLGIRKNIEKEGQRFDAYVKENSYTVFEDLDSIIEDINIRISEYLTQTTGLKSKSFTVGPS